MYNFVFRLSLDDAMSLYMPDNKLVFVWLYRCNICAYIVPAHFGNILDSSRI